MLHANVSSPPPAQPSFSAHKHLPEFLVDRWPQHTWSPFPAFLTFPGPAHSCLLPSPPRSWNCPPCNLKSFHPEATASSGRPCRSRSCSRSREGRPGAHANVTPAADCHAVQARFLRDSLFCLRCCAGADAASGRTTKPTQAFPACAVARILHPIFSHICDGGHSRGLALGAGARRHA